MTSPAFAKTIGVIGGLGPAATLDFFDKVLRATPAKRDQDHLHLIIDNNPRLPDRNLALRGEGPSPGPALAAMARGLERSSAQAVVMVCNTAHAWQSEIEAALTVPFLSMVDATIAATRARTKGKVGVLVADGARLAGLYQKGFDADALLLNDSDQARFMQAIYAIKAGDTGAGMRRAMAGFAEQLIAQGASVIVAACTEVPLALSAEDLAVPFISSTDALVARTLDFALGVRP